MGIVSLHIKIHMKENSICLSKIVTIQKTGKWSLKMKLKEK